MVISTSFPGLYLRQPPSNFSWYEHNSQIKLIKSSLSIGGYVTLAVFDSVKERCLRWIGRERKLTLILTLILTLSLIPNPNPNPKH